MIVRQIPDVSDRYTTHLIRQTARTLIAEGFYKPDELDDVIQDLTLALLKQSENFNPEKARWTTFVKTVVQHTSVDLRRQQQADCRVAVSRFGTLDVPIDDEDGQSISLGASVSEEEFRTGQGLGFISHTDQVDMALDVQQALEALPQELRSICELLPQMPLAQVATQLGITRRTLQRRLQEIREHFRKADLEPPKPRK